jgi:hypothetical protein
MAETTKERKPWEQQKGEPNDAYSHFLAYRNLGPGRTIDAAYSLAKAPRRGMTRQTSAAKRAPGNWDLESVKWNWVDRAISWDIEMLETQGREVVTLYFAALRKAALKILNALDEKRIRPKGWQGVLDGLHELSNVIPAETVEALRANAGCAGGEAGAGDAPGLPPPATDDDVDRFVGVDRKQ